MRDDGYYLPRYDYQEALRMTVCSVLGAGLALLAFVVGPVVLDPVVNGPAPVVYSEDAIEASRARRMVYKLSHELEEIERRHRVSHEHNPLLKYHCALCDDVLGSQMISEAGEIQELLGRWQTRRVEVNRRE